MFKKGDRVVRVSSEHDTHLGVRNGDIHYIAEDQKESDTIKLIGFTENSAFMANKFILFNPKEKTNDQVNKPSYYQSSKFEVIDIIEEFKLGFNLGNVIKYTLRAGKKDPKKHLEDLQKAVYYLNREISNLEKK